MAWRQESTSSGDDFWINEETGQFSSTNPNPAAPIAAPSGQYAQTYTRDDGSGAAYSYYDPVTGAALSDQQVEQLQDAEFQKVWSDQNASPWDKAQAVEKRYGIEALAQLSGQGYFGAYAAELGPYIASRQAEAESEGFQLGGRSLGLWPVALGMGAGAIYGATAAGAAGAVAGEGTAAGGAALAGGGEVGSGYAASAPGAIGGAGAGASATPLSELYAAGGNTMTDVPLVGGNEAAGSLANYEAAVNAQYGTPLQTGSGSLAQNVGTGAAVAGGGALVNGVMTDGATGGGEALGSGGGSAGNAAAGAGAGTALSRLLDGSASTADYLSLLGTAGATGLGIYGANQQTKSLEELAGQYMAMGAPSRGRYESSFAPGFSMASDPGFTDSMNQAAKATLHGLSVTGNPADSPNAWASSLQDLYQKSAYPALQGYRSMNANAGGLSRFAEAAPGAATGAIGAQRGVYDAVGYGAANLFNPPSTLEQLMRAYR